MLRIRSLAVNLPFGFGGVTMDVSEAEVRAAWQLYVELATRVATQELEPRAGSAREALASLHSIFVTTRDILREAGPEVGDGPEALGPLAIRILNEGLRPFLIRWHTELHAGGGGEPTEDRRRAFDAELTLLRQDLRVYVDALGLIAGVAAPSRTERTENAGP